MPTTAAAPDSPAAEVKITSSERSDLLKAVELFRAPLHCSTCKGKKLTTQQGDGGDNTTSYPLLYTFTSCCQKSSCLECIGEMNVGMLSLTTNTTKKKKKKEKGARKPRRVSSPNSTTTTTTATTKTKGE